MEALWERKGGEAGSREADQRAVAVVRAVPASLSLEMGGELVGGWVCRTQRRASIWERRQHGQHPDFCWGGALGLGQIWAGGQCIKMPTAHPGVCPAGGWSSEGRPSPRTCLCLGLHWGKTAPRGGRGGRCQEEAQGHGSFLIIPFWAVGCSGQGPTSCSRKEATVCGRRGRACGPVISWVTAGREGGSRDGGLSGQERTG